MKDFDKVAKKFNFNKIGCIYRYESRSGDKYSFVIINEESFNKIKIIYGCYSIPCFTLAGKELRVMYSEKLWGVVSECCENNENIMEAIMEYFFFLTPNTGF